MSALGANRTRRDSGNDVNDPKQPWHERGSLQLLGVEQFIFIPLPTSRELL
jgi:hypothetical protein